MASTGEAANPTPSALLAQGSRQHGHGKRSRAHTHSAAARLSDKSACTEAVRIQCSPHYLLSTQEITDYHYCGCFCPCCSSPFGARQDWRSQPPCLKKAGIRYYPSSRSFLLLYGTLHICNYMLMSLVLLFFMFPPPDGGTGGDRLGFATHCMAGLRTASVSVGIDDKY